MLSYLRCSKAAGINQIVNTDISMQLYRTAQFANPTDLFSAELRTQFVLVKRSIYVSHITTKPPK